MTDYTKSTNFAAKDALSSGDPNKVVKGAEIDTEYNNIETAVNSKLDASRFPNVDGNVTASDEELNNIDGLTVDLSGLTSTATELNRVDDDGSEVSIARVWNYTNGVKSNGNVVAEGVVASSHANSDTPVKFTYTTISVAPGTSSASNGHGITNLISNFDVCQISVTLESGSYVYEATTAYNINPVDEVRVDNTNAYISRNGSNLEIGTYKILIAYI